MQETSEPRAYVCADCNFTLRLADESEPIESFEGLTGAAIHRVVTLDGVEIHRCGSVFLTMSTPIEPTVVADAATNSW